MAVPSGSLTQLEHRLGLVLKAGVTVSALALAVGVCAWLALGERPESTWLLRAGLFALMATPIIRVVVSLAGYVRMRDWVFVATTAAVLAELAVAMLSALTRR